MCGFGGLANQGIFGQAFVDEVPVQVHVQVK